MLATRQRSQLLLIDIQPKLHAAMEPGPRVLENAIRLVTAARRLGVPITISEQYPKGLGHTIPELREAAGPDAVVVEKMTFSCWREDRLRARIDALRQDGRDQVIVGGMESHICVCQTALDLIANDYEVFLAADTIASRIAQSREVALSRMRHAGAVHASLETIVFEWLERAGTPEFRDLIGLIK